MRALLFLFSPSGRLRPGPFIAAAIAVYVAGVASQWLTMPAVIARGGIWIYLAVQVVLIWIWFAVHARRLHDAGRSEGLAGGASVLYALAIVLFVLLVASFGGAANLASDNPNGTGALTFILFIWIVAILSQAHSIGLIWALAAILTVIAFIPIALVVFVTAWAATRPVSEEPS